MDNTFQMVAKTFQGLEDVLRDELIALGAKNVEIGKRMVSFEGDLETMYRANLCCRTALRILKPIVKFTADDTDELYDAVRDIDWTQYLSPDSTFAIDSTVNSAEFTHSRFVTYRVKDGIVDHFNDRFGRRPSIRLTGADLLLNVHISDNRVTISLDSSGEPLSKRGYRAEQTEAPINEVLAAGIIMKTGWRGDCDFVDPMCGSGTFLIEAALIAANINPGIYRQSFAFEKWPDFNKELFEEIYNDDSAEREFAYKIYGGDIDPEAVTIARRNIHSANVGEMIDLVCRPFADWTENGPEGILVTNPPYGERLRPDDMSALYKGIGQTLKRYFKGWHAWILGYREEHFREIGLKPSVKFPILNGSLECSLNEYVLFDGSYSDFRAAGGSVANEDFKHEEGPRKVKHISEDEWKKETSRFSGRPADDRHDRRGGGADRHKAQRDFNRGEKDFRRRENSGEYGDRNFGFRADRKEKPFNRHDDRKERNFDRRSDNRGDSFRRNDRDDRKERKFDRDNRDFPRRKDSAPSPARKIFDKGPRLSEDSAVVFDPKKNMRSRKGWKKQD